MLVSPEFRIWQGAYEMEELAINSGISMTFGHNPQSILGALIELGARIQNAENSLLISLSDPVLPLC